MKLTCLMDSFSYAAGMNIGTNMRAQGFTTVKGDLMGNACNNVIKNRPLLFTSQVANMKLQEKIMAFIKKKAEEEKIIGATFLAANKQRKEGPVKQNKTGWSITFRGTTEV